jgi:hypothetical protein
VCAKTRIVWRVVAGVIVAAALAACGSSDDSGRHRSAAGEAAQMQQAVKRKAVAAYTECQTDLGELVGRLRDLDGRVASGLSFSEYASQLEDIRTAYDRIPLRRIKDARCLGSVGVPIENAFNEHVKAARAWHSCLTRPPCRVATVRPALRRRWARASRLAAGAQTNLELLRRP